MQKSSSFDSIANDAGTLRASTSSTVSHGGAVSTLQETPLLPIELSIEGRMGESAPEFQLRMEVGVQSFTICQPRETMAEAQWLLEQFRKALDAAQWSRSSAPNATRRLTEDEINAQSWWCPHCRESVPAEMVTKDGEHYLESGGCGRPVRADGALSETGIVALTSTPTVTFGAPPPKGPCMVCGKSLAVHGSYPTCATHPFTDDANCKYLLGARCPGTECVNGCVRARAVAGSSVSRSSLCERDCGEAAVGGPRCDAACALLDLYPMEAAEGLRQPALATQTSTATANPDGCEARAAVPATSRSNEQNTPSIKE